MFEQGQRRQLTHPPTAQEHSLGKGGRRADFKDPPPGHRRGGRMDTLSSLSFFFSISASKFILSPPSPPIPAAGECLSCLHPSSPSPRRFPPLPSLAITVCAPSLLRLTGVGWLQEVVRSPSGHLRLPSSRRGVELQTGGERGKEGGRAGGKAGGRWCESQDV